MQLFKLLSFPPLKPEKSTLNPKPWNPTLAGFERTVLLVGSVWGLCLGDGMQSCSLMVTVTVTVRVQCRTGNPKP